MKIRSTFVSNSSSSSFILRTTGPSELINLLEEQSDTGYSDECSISNTFQNEELIEEIEDLEEHIADMTAKLAVVPPSDSKLKYYGEEANLQQRKESAQDRLEYYKELIDNRNAWILRISNHNTLIKALLELAIDSDPKVTMEEW